MIQADTVDAPDYWASYLINGDASGITEAERIACDAWQSSIEPWYVVSCTDDEPRFTWHYRLYGGDAEGGSVCTYVIYQENIP